MNQATTKFGGETSLKCLNLNEKSKLNSLEGAYLNSYLNRWIIRFTIKVSRMLIMMQVIMGKKS